MNKVFLIGRMVKDPELRYTPGKGTAVVSVTLAVDKYNTKTGQNEADFIPIVVWGKQAENLSSHMTKGSMIAVSGRIQTRSYDAKDGSKRYVTEVVADMQSGIKFLSKSVNQDSNGSNNYGDMNQERYDCDNDITPVDDGDMPF